MFPLGERPARRPGERVRFLPADESYQVVMLRSSECGMLDLVERTCETLLLGALGESAPEPAGRPLPRPGRACSAR